MRILITGAGYLGLAIIRSLSNTDNQVTVFVRKRDLRIPDNVNQIQADLLTGKIPEIYEPFDVCINVVGIIKEDHKRGQTFVSIYEQYPKILLDFLIKNGTRKIVQISANGVTENSASRYFQGKWKSEQLIKNSGLSYTIIRPSFIFSKGDISINFFADVIKKFHLFPIFEKGEKKLRPIYLGDVVEIVNKCMYMDTDNMILEIGGPEEFTYKEFFKLIAQKLSTKVYLINFPTSITSFILKFIGDIPFMPLTYDQFLMLCTDNTTSLEFLEKINMNLHKFTDLFPAYKIVNKES